MKKYLIPRNPCVDDYDLQDLIGSTVVSIENVFYLKKEVEEAAICVTFRKSRGAYVDLVITKDGVWHDCEVLKNNTDTIESLHERVSKLEVIMRDNIGVSTEELCKSIDNYLGSIMAESSRGTPKPRD